MVSIIVEGWRFLPHSYAIFNQFQCLELLKRPDVEVFHRDSPYYGKDWQPVTGLFDESAEAALKAMSSPPPNREADATLRINFPFNFKPSHAKRTGVFGTCEFGVISPQGILGYSSLREAHQNSEVILITSSNWSRNGFIRSGADPNQTVYIPLGVDSNIYRPVTEEKRQSIRQKLGINGFAFLHIGAMTGNKGIHLLLKAFLAISDRYPDAKLVLKGLNSLYNSETNLVKAIRQELTESETKKVLQRSIYLGQPMSFSEIAELYQSADAYVSPYLGEGFNMPVLEAAACGLPIICTKGGSTDDFTTPEFALHIQSEVHEFPVEWGETGVGLTPNLEHLIFLMETAIEQEEFRIQARQAAPKFVASGFTWQHIVDQLLGVLVPSRTR